MCISSAPAEFFGTTVSLNVTNHPIHGLIHVLGYQNTAVNRSRGPNAMLLHLPGSGMSQKNFLDTSSCKNILKDQVEACIERTRGGTRSLGLDSFSVPVQVFEHDIYTVVLTENPRLIPDALQQVPEHKRPHISDELVGFYAERFPGWSMALCCFDNRQANQAAPLLMWYHPLPSETALRLPALDSHTGGVPDLEDYVEVDHWVIVSGPGLKYGRPVYYTDEIPSELKDFLPTKVLGKQFFADMPNGDFVLRQNVLSEGYFSRGSMLRANAPMSA